MNIVNITLFLKYGFFFQIRGQKKGISKEVMIIGGIAVLVIAAYGFSVMQKNKKVQIQSA